MKIRKGDQIVVVAGKNKGKTGEVMRVMPKQERIVVKDVNKITRHVKKTKDRPGQKISFESPIHISNVMLVDPKTKKRTRVGYEKDDKAKKNRISKKSKSIL
jgi:large subunit ribosomal protein L24